jgi:hypothetical protein
MPAMAKMLLHSMQSKPPAIMQTCCFADMRELSGSMRAQNGIAGMLQICDTKESMKWPYMENIQKMNSKPGEKKDSDSRYRKKGGSHAICQHSCNRGQGGTKPGAKGPAYQGRYRTSVQGTAKESCDNLCDY